MPAVHINAYVTEQYNTCVKVTLENQLVELPRNFELDKASTSDIEKLRGLVADRIATVEVELMRQLNFALLTARERERAAAEAERADALARDDVPAGQPDGEPVPFEG